MKKSKLSILSLVALSTLGLASCKDTPEQPKVDVPWSDPAGTSLNIYLNYNGKNGISYQKTEAFVNTVDGITYSQGDLLPTWKELASRTGMTFKDVASYTDKKDDDAYKSVEAKGFTGTNGAPIDLFYNSVNNMKKMGDNQKAVDIMPYLKAGKMPYFQAYLDKNPEVLDMCVVYDSNGEQHLYYTPYFDGYQQIERMFIMDTEMVERLLDVDGAGDDAAAKGDKKLSGVYYKPFLDSNKNYKDAKTKIKVVSGDTVTEVEVVQTNNIIKQQNELLAGDVKGKELVAQFQAYLKAAYPSYSGKLSEVFTGVNAIYNADDLVALMRVVRANPATATGVATCEEVVTLFPRGAAANRMENMQDFAEIWGVNGLDSESNNLFFDGAGKLNVVGGTQQNYDALVLLNQLYNEGLIQENFYEKGDSNAYLNRYFKNSDKENSGAGFMLYDYCASTTVGNAVDANGIGTKKESRNGVYAGIDRTGIRPVLAPVTYWNTSYELKNTDALFDANGQVYNRDQKTLTRFSDSNRALKGNSWCIPSNSTNIPGAVTLMDYLYSEEGSYINDFGPQPYRGEMSSDIIFGQSVPTLGAKLIDMYLKSGTDFWSFMREYIGSTNGIGSVRSDALDMQVTNQYAAVGLKNVQKAIKLGAMTLAKCKTAENYGWDACVPTNWQVSENATAKKNYEKVTNFWAAGSTGSTGWRAVVTAPIGDLNKVNVDEGTTYADVIAQRDVYNKEYLSIWSESIECTPSWLENLLSGK